MTPVRWHRIEHLYHSAREREESQRVAFLEEACAGDEDLRQEIESLLAEEKREAGFLESPALEIAAKEMARDGTRSLLGQRLGSYQVACLLGKGGMGEVWKARDPRVGDVVPTREVVQLQLARQGSQRRVARARPRQIQLPQLVAGREVRDSFVGDWRSGE